MKKLVVFSSLFVFLIAVFVPASIQGQEMQTAVSDDDPVFTSDASAPPTDQIIIKFNDSAAENSLLAVDAQAQLAALSAAAGVPLDYYRPMSGESHVLKLAEWMPIADVERIAADLSAMPGVAYAEPDRIKTIDTGANDQPALPNLTPNDPRFNQMWHLGYTANTAEGLNLLPAWDIYTGSSSTVVAVIDTGILNHTDLAGKIVPGYDFITNPTVGNDGDGRDNDPSDPGDWVAANECYSGNSARDSSWHGTHVAGTIGAASNNNLGITGVDWNAKILPLRVLGKCGGTTSDIVDAMRWAAGLSVSGVPANANPADVLNLSLGGPGSCSITEQNAINAVVATGATFVIAAGNDNTNASGFSPGNCDNIITVAATNRTGDRAYYSNYGNVIEVSAPGGETPGDSANGILSTLDTGTTTPNNSNTYAFYQGTSMATPHVAGLASLIKGMRPAYTQAQVLSLLQSTARSFPAGSTCNTSNCGAGIIDAYQALRSLNINYTDSIYLPIITKQLPPPPPQNPILNPGFESGAASWTKYSTHGWPVIMNAGFPGTVAPHTGSWAAWLGGDYDDISYVQQQVTVPASTPHLTYWHWIASQDICGFDYGGVLVNGTVVDQYDLCDDNDTHGWVKHSVNLAAYAGQSVTIQVRVETDNLLNSNLFVDDFSFAATPAVNVAPLPAVDGGEADMAHQP
jgi:serine protease